MKRNAFCLTLGALLLTGAMLSPLSLFAIVNGRLDVQTEFPNVGAIVATKIPPTFPGVTPPQTISSGTLVHPRVLLTAAHSIAFMDELMAVEGGLTLDDFGVSFELDAHHDQESYIGIAALMTHDEFRSINGRGRPEVSLDVGVIILERPVRNVEPVELARPRLLDDVNLVRQHSPFTVVGYGATLLSEFPPPQIDVFPLPDGRRRSATSTFQALRHHYLLLSQKLAQGEGGISNGDSGGPAFYTDPDTLRRVQVGIASTEDGASASLGVFNRTDLPEVRDFVRDVIAMVDGA